MAGNGICIALMYQKIRKCGFFCGGGGQMWCFGENDVIFLGGMWADIVLELPMMNRRNYLTLIGETIYEVSAKL